MGLCLHSFTIIPKLENRIEKYTQSAWERDKIYYNKIILLCRYFLSSPESTYSADIELQMKPDGNFLLYTVATISSPSPDSIFG